MIGGKLMNEHLLKAVLRLDRVCEVQSKLQ